MIDNRRMPRASGRHFGPLEQKALLAALKDCRRALIDAERHAPPNSDVYRATGPVLDVIDDLAGVLTGNREHFHLPMAGQAIDV